jgi:hypothetical protein
MERATISTQVWCQVLTAALDHQNAAPVRSAIQTIGEPVRIE